MSGIPQPGWESDDFVTVDDHISFVRAEVEDTLDHLGEALIRQIGEFESLELKLLAEKLLRVAEYEDIDTEVLETAKRAFFFGKLIGFIVLENETISFSYMNNAYGTEEHSEEQSEQFDILVAGSQCELRDSPLFKGFVDEHKWLLDPSGNRGDVVDLFAGFSLFIMQNTLYFAAEAGRIDDTAKEMSEASDEDWQKSLDTLFGE